MVMVRKATEVFAAKIPEPIAKAMSPWLMIPGGREVMKALVDLAPLPIPPAAREALRGYVAGVSRGEARAVADGAASAAAK